MSTSTTQEKVFGALIFGAALPGILFVVGFPLAFVRAWVLCALWRWYVTPAFDVQPLRMVYAFGISLLVTYLIRRPRTDDTTGMAKDLGMFAANAAFVLLAGWIGTLFI